MDTARADDQAADGSDEKLFAVEAIEDVYYPRSGPLRCIYFVKWLDYPSSDNTWEPPVSTTTRQ